MTHPAPEVPLAALREEIREAGRRVRAWRVCLMLNSCAVFWSGVVSLSAYLILGEPFWHSWTAGVALVVLALIGTPLLACTSYFAGGMLRLRKRQQLRRRLLHLPPEQWCAALAPFPSGEGEAWKLVRPLRLELGLPTELTPAAPASRGDEPTPAGDP